MEDDTPPLFIPDGPDLQEQRRVRASRMVRNLRACIWPLCQRPCDRDMESPLCGPHGRTLASKYDMKRIQLIHERIDRAEAKKPVDPVQVARTVARTVGQVYYIRLNDVIKIGWSSQLHVRLRDYGAGAVLLAHHPGSRADERDLHRTFRIFRVHGREWYDGSTQILLDHIANMLDEYGPPLFEVERNARSRQQTGKHWTGPKTA